ncbi:MAG: hypothetical protein HMLKMBBP_03014 [Planctomycetes bacterium]|nr:hypothetical protein [Planctomycetota bacterium]
MSPNAESGEPRRTASRRASPPTPRYDPFERVYGADGTIDKDYASSRLPTLVELLRRHPACFAARIPLEPLGIALSGNDASGLRGAPDQDAFEKELRGFSERHLHELVSEELGKTLHAGLMGIARDEHASRRDRGSAALGLAVLAAAPDRTGLRGRGMFDLVLRVTMEEQTAHEQLRKKARETEGGLAPEELGKFWEEYPALRWHLEDDYRKRVARVLAEIEKGNLPIAVSVDLAMRGAAALLGEVARAKGDGGVIDAKRAEEILRDPFENDFLDDGAEIVAARWRREADAAADLPSDERRQFARLVDMAERLLRERGPGTPSILFFAYMRAVVHGQYYVRDAADLEAARQVFGTTGLEPAGALSYAAHLGNVDPAARRRVLLAAVEIWPKDESVRAAAAEMAESEMAAAAKAKQGPTYAEHGETVPEPGTEDEA